MAVVGKFQVEIKDDAGKDEAHFRIRKTATAVSVVFFSEPQFRLKPVTHLRPIQFLGPQLNGCDASRILPASLASSSPRKNRSGLNFQGSTQLPELWLMDHGWTSTKDCLRVNRENTLTSTYNLYLKVSGTYTAGDVMASNLAPLWRNDPDQV